MIRVGVDDDKYTVLIPDLHDEEPLRVLCYGEEWRDCTDDNLIFHLACELDEARKRIQAMVDGKTAHEQKVGHAGSCCHWDDQGVGMCDCGFIKVAP